MASHKNQQQNSGKTPIVMPAKSGVDALGLATLAGVVVVLMISFSNLRAIDSLRADFDKVEDKVAAAGRTQIPAQVTPTAQQKPPPRRGPDPERQYQIKTAGAPTKGAERAPITIAEFSDFQ